MPPQNPDWVKALKPSGPQGSELLAQERSNSDINVDKLSTFLFTKEVLERNDKILKILQADPVFDKEQNYFRGRTDRLEAALARGKALRRLSVKHNWNEEEHHAANDLISEPTPYGLHATMFLKTLEEQGTPAQHKLFLERARNYEIIGCYAQTELGHGSNVRGLETTATWNHEDKTFTIHSPHLTASKWWIGSLGKAANHAVVVAQLILNGKPYGPHPFVVPIRDMKTHEPLPDIHVGDIGPKFGYNTMDNGFLLFNNVKIPHVNMLNRFSGVDPETGKYIRPSNPALIYGTLTFIRSSIVFQSGSVLARGVTIATRYCAVRRQFQDRDADASETGENQVLNYTMVQHRLLPLLASSYALFFTGRAMINLYNANQKRMAQRRDAGDANRKPGPEELSPGSDHLADLHAISCSLKAFASTTAAEGLEVCRRACGGHGYSAFSGIGSWYADYLPTVTWEGDNYMLTQQVARYLLKSARAVLAGKAPDNGISRIFKEFIRRQDIGAAFDVLDSDQDLVDAFAWRVSFLTFEALKHRDEEKQSWNSLLIDFWRLSTAYAQYQVVKNFHEALQDEATKKSLDPNTLAIMHKLFELFALHNLQSSASEFFTSAATTVRQIQLARTKRTLSLLDEIRPHAVRLVDAWSFPDWQLDSALGRYDGKVYEDLFHRASEVNPVNDIVFDPYPESDVLFRKNGSGPKAKLRWYNVLIYGFRNYGMSGGHYESYDAIGALRYIRKHKDIKDTIISLLARHMGGSIDFFAMGKHPYGLRDTRAVVFLSQHEQPSNVILYHCSITPLRIRLGRDDMAILTGSLPPHLHSSRNATNYSTNELQATLFPTSFYATSSFRPQTKSSTPRSSTSSTWINCSTMATDRQPEIILYDLECIKNTCFSPVVWKIRLMLNYKGIPYKTIFLEFPDIEPRLKELSGSARYTVPTIHHVPTGKYIMNSPAIAEFLESTYPNPPLLLSSELGREIEARARGAIGPAFRISVTPRENLILSPRAQEYFRAKNEARMGCKLEDLMDPEKEEKTWKAVADKMSELSDLMLTNKDKGPFLLGEKPSYTDFFIAASLQSARTIDEEIFQRCAAYPGFKAIYDACIPWMEKKN
ncbi:acyl-CoA oxidase [Fusarium bulbicola]|nr:acyl-CoA oxidase [Fusarium bulbicola]